MKPGERPLEDAPEGRGQASMDNQVIKQQIVDHLGVVCTHVLELMVQDLQDRPRSTHDSDWDIELIKDHLKTRYQFLPFRVGRSCSPLGHPQTCVFADFPIAEHDKQILRGVCSYPIEWHDDQMI